MNWKKGIPQVVKFGKTGREADGFHDPAGLACDAFGNVIINDAGNKAIKVEKKSGEENSLFVMIRSLV